MNIKQSFYGLWTILAIVLLYTPFLMRRLFTYSEVAGYEVRIALLFDQWRQFKWMVFQRMCKILGMQKTWTTALHAQSDLLLQRFNWTSFEVGCGDIFIIKSDCPYYVVLVVYHLSSTQNNLQNFNIDSFLQWTLLAQCPEL